MSDISDIAEALKARTSPVVIDIATRRKGTSCLVYFPTGSTSVYGQSDNRYTYNTTPDYVGLVLITGLQGERREGDRSFDNFQEQPPEAWSRSDQEWPRNTLIKAQMRTRVLTFRVDKILGTTGNDKFLYRHYNLIPVEDKNT